MHFEKQQFTHNSTFVYIMAAKSEHVLVAACLFCILINIFSFISCTTTPSTETSTATDSTTTTAAVTTETTVTTQPTTTQPPTTTTTPLPTLPPTQVSSVTDISPCPCDLTGLSCDINCCCDLDCSSDDRSVFTECLTSSGNVDDRLCVQQDILLLENAPFPKNFTQDGLFCIYFDNYEERNYYNIPDLITDTTVFQNYLDEYAGPSYSDSQSGQSTISDHYRYGDPVYIVYETLATGYLGLPKSITSTGCTDSPVAYLKDEESSCVRQITTLDQTTCEGTTAFNAQSYYTGFRVVTTPYLFTYIINGTVITTTPSTTVTTTTPAVSATTDINATTVTVATTTPGTVSTTPGTPSQINLYNNTYTIDMGLSSVECRDATGTVITCNFATGTVPTPDFAGDTCSNVVKEVEYLITHDGTTGITTADVRFILQNINVNNLPLPQTFKSSFSAAGDANITEWSGNPGYVVGKPVRAGIRFINESFGNRNMIVENGYELSIVKSSATGTCLQDANNRVQVNFGQEMRSGCLIRFNLDTVTTADYCTAMQQAINLALEGSSDYINTDPILNRYVATFGNSELEQTGDWVPVLKIPGTTTTASPNLDGPSCQLSMGMHIQIVYSNVGSIANPQSKILGVAFIYEDQQSITYTCSGTACQPGNSQVDQSFEISQSVSFVDVSGTATGAVGEAPIFIAKVPNDFFYPFATGSGNSLRPYTTCVAVLVCILNTLLVYV